MDVKAFAALLPQATQQLPRGAFLIAGGEIWNPMTIGWAQFGVVWARPVVTVMVRKSRYTHSLMEGTDVFTLSIPREKEMGKALAFCGARSGRDSNKEKEANLSRLAPRAGAAEAVAGCGIVFECRIVQKQLLELDTLDPDFRAKYYGSNQALENGDPHVLYVGEVLAAYEVEST
jgi:flavin reductase (DIM6/NTAB) family NADH-FMN oxidoreductase RutF